MGVAGSGKTTIGRQLADEIGCSFVDADWFHSAANVAKLRAGVRLSDEDRLPWLNRLRREVLEPAHRGGGCVVLACSALRASHRRILAESGGRVRFVYLRVSPDVVAERLRTRSAHFMNPGLITSQFADLEEPDDSITVDGTQAPAAIVMQVRRAMAAPPSGQG